MEQPRPCTFNLLECENCTIQLINFLVFLCNTPDIATFVPWTEFEYCPDKEFDYCYTFSNGRYPKTELDSQITYLTKTKDKNVFRFSSKETIKFWN